MSLVALGMSNGEIARELAVSSRTIAKHLQNIFGKLGVATRGAAVNKAREPSC